MRELLHIPTGNVLRWRLLDGLHPFEDVCRIPEHAQGYIRDIASGRYYEEFYSRNGIPETCSQAEYEVIEV